MGLFWDLDRGKPVSAQAVVLALAGIGIAAFLVITVLQPHVGAAADPPAWSCESLPVGVKNAGSVERCARAATSSTEVCYILRNQFDGEEGISCVRY